MHAGIPMTFEDEWRVSWASGLKHLCGPRRQVDYGPLIRLIHEWHVSLGERSAFVEPHDCSLQN